MSVVWWIIVGLIAGWATGKIMRGAGYGAVIDIVIGIIGAVVGGWIMRSLGFRRPRRHDLYHPRGDWRSNRAYVPVPPHRWQPFRGHGIWRHATRSLIRTRRLQTGNRTCTVGQSEAPKWRSRLGWILHWRSRPFWSECKR